MYYEEKVINGKTVYRTSPGGIWIDRSNKQLSADISSLRQENERLRGALLDITYKDRNAVRVSFREHVDLTEYHPILHEIHSRQALTKEG